MCLTRSLVTVSVGSAMTVASHIAVSSSTFDIRGEVSSGEIRDGVWVASSLAVSMLAVVRGKSGLLTTAHGSGYVLCIPWSNAASVISVIAPTSVGVASGGADGSVRGTPVL